LVTHQIPHFKLSLLITNNLTAIQNTHAQAIEHMQFVKLTLEIITRQLVDVTDIC